MAITPRIEIYPRSSLIDERVMIRLTGFTPWQRVLVRARTRDDDFGRLWESYAVYEVDIHGKVDLTWREPLEGSYRGADGMGLFWSMELDPSAEEECYFRKTSLEPIHIQVSAEIDGEPVVEAAVERKFVAEKVDRREIRENGLVGVLFTPGGSGPFPGVIVLGGGDGGIREHGAALLASRGYAALALGYFNMDGLPPEPVEIPLEYFQRAIYRLQDHSNVDNQSLAVIGTSLGGMYALLVASKFPAVTALVAYVPLGVVMCMGPEKGTPATFRGLPLPCIPVLEPTTEDFQHFEKMAQQRIPVSFNSLHLRALENEAAVKQAAIHTEHINGPVLLMTGADDRALPSPYYAQQIMARLDELNFPYDHQHVSYPEAGHAIGLPHAHGLPYVPTYGRPPTKSEEPLIDFGGNKAANARANIESWKKLLRFLSDNLKQNTE